MYITFDYKQNKNIINFINLIISGEALLKNIILLIIIISTYSLSSMITPIPLKSEIYLKKALLGKKLFNDTILSIDNTISCSSCHILSDGGDDNNAFSIGINNQMGNINAPTVLNSVFNFRQFWNGRAKDLKEQAMEPIENPIEMGNSFELLIPKLKKTSYNNEFKEIYEDGITKENIVDAIAEFEKALITPNAPFDRYLKGEKDAITEVQKEGFELFKNKGCIACHQGVNLGGNLYSKFGVMSDIESNNLGRFLVTKKEKDKNFFKVPSLRNIEKTAPYFHDARTSSLHETVKIMALYQLGRPITNDEVSKIVEFLKSLTAPLPEIAK